MQKDQEGTKAMSKAKRVPSTRAYTMGQIMFNKGASVEDNPFSQPDNREDWILGYEWSEKHFEGAYVKNNIGGINE